MYRGESDCQSVRESVIGADIDLVGRIVESRLDNEVAISDSGMGIRQMYAPAISLRQRSWVLDVLGQPPTRRSAFASEGANGFGRSFDLPM